METFGAFTPQLKSWIEDRLGVNRVIIEVEWVGRRPARSSLPAPIPIPVVRLEHRYEDGGSRGVSTFYYEGVDPDAAVDAESNVVYDIEGSFTQEPISSHPDIAKLLKDYGGYLEEGEIVWDDRAPSPTNAKGRRGVNAQTGKVVNDLNPMLGVNSFYSFGAVWTQTRVRRLSSIPPSILRNVGKISKPPGPVPDVPDRTWLEAAPQGTLRGNVLQIKRRWILSGIGGWLEPVYSGQDLGFDSNEDTD